MRYIFRLLISDRNYKTSGDLVEKTIIVIVFLNEVSNLTLQCICFREVQLGKALLTITQTFLSFLLRTSGQLNNNKPLRQVCSSSCLILGPKLLVCSLNQTSDFEIIKELTPKQNLASSLLFKLFHHI